MKNVSIVHGAFDGRDPRRNCQVFSSIDLEVWDILRTISQKPLQCAKQVFIARF